MGKGFLRIQTVTNNGTVAICGASVTLSDEHNQVLHELSTDEFGNAPEVELEAPDKWHTEDPFAPGPRCSTYNASVRADGYITVIYSGVMIFDTSTSLLKVEMDPSVPGQENSVKYITIGGHKLDPTEADMPPFPGVSLKVGSAGQNVRYVQGAINKLAGTTPGLWKITEDGIFGNRTRDAVLAFQRMFGLTVDGIVGVNTWGKLMEEAYKTPGSTPGSTPATPPFPGADLSAGSRGQNVLSVQQALNKLAPHHPGRLWILVEDGIFGSITRDAVYTFQNLFGLPITGIVTQATWIRLMQESAQAGRSAPPFPSVTLSVGSSGQNVLSVQRALNKLAPSYPGRLWILVEDGIFGSITRDAVYTFQNLFGLPMTGIINQATWTRIMQESAYTG
ncbi:MAG: peptidoglycan-binding protein [Peptococcaceae bacterium]|nr:peptidoglycan-binding protein [Peptococcaceae bacterium]